MKNVICFLLFCLGLTTANAQGWERFYPELTSLDLDYGAVPTPDGGLLLTADDEYWGLDPHLLLKIAPGGATQSLQEQSNFFTGYKPALLTVANDHLLFAAFNPATSTTDLTKTDGNLQVIWTHSVPGIYLNNYLPPHLKATPDGYLIAYQNGHDDAPVKVSKTNLEGETLWQKTYDFTALGTPMRYFLAMAADSEGDFYLSGVQDFPYVPVLGKFSPAGDLIYLKTYPQPNLIYGFGSLAVLQDSLIAAVSSSNTAILNAENGAVLSTIAAPEVGVALTSMDDKLLLYGRDGQNLLLRKLEWNGSPIWERTFDRPETLELASHLWSLPDGGVMGLARAFTGVGYTPFVFRTDANGVTYTSRLHGNIFTDLNVDCIADTSAANRIVIAAKPGDTRYATTDSQGNYDFSIDTGTYLISVVPPNDLWAICQDSASLTVSSGDTLQWNTGITADISCPWPTVDLSALFLRRCFPSTYTVEYSNEGSIAADSAVVTLFLDPFLTLESASLPYSDLGNNVYAFLVGDVAPLETGTFTVTVLVSCDAQLGQTHCSSVSIGIANPCPTTLEDISVIQVEAVCEGDSVVFTIKNVGGAPMQNAAEFVIIEDLIVMRQGQFQLPPQGEYAVKCPADGSTSRIYAGHAPGEAPFFAATTAIEGCNGPVQPGFWNMFPEMFVSQNADRDCQPNIGAYDPNDKQAVPTGYDTEHYIGRGVDLNYKIRFQNTGTDTAFTVTVRDTLSPWLDAASARPGAASHPYTWQLLGAGVLQFKFENILLPDSSTNLAGSQGYITFRIEQKQDVPLQTLIENRAAIFFDFNAPVLTNTTFHRVGEKFIHVSAWEPNQASVQVRAVPNPFVSETQLEVLGLASRASLLLQIFDLHGKTVREMTDEAGIFRVKKGDLRSGVYPFNIKQNGLLVGQGKLVVQD
ncbi:MAG: hypothetical protein ACKVUS_00780 [Saprospiraceae bacterium]